MEDTRWTHCVIIEAPTEPAPEADLKYKVRLYNVRGLTEVHEEVVTAIQKWGGYDCMPATVAGASPAPDVPPHPKLGWPVHWVGQQWEAWIEHVPAPFDCDSTGNSIPIELIHQLAKQAAKAAIADAKPSLSQTMPHFQTSRDDVDLATAFEPLTLPHAGATGVRWSVAAEDDETWDTGVIAVEQTVDGVLWQEVETITEPGMRTTPLDSRGVIETRLMPKTANGGEKRVRLSLAGDGGMV